MASDGEPAFRAEESRALADAVDAPGPLVISAAGGTVLDPKNRELLRRAGTVGRPLLSPDPAAAIPRLDADRRPFYDEVADVVVDVDGRTADEVVGRIMEAVK